MRKFFVFLLPLLLFQTVAAQLPCGTPKLGQPEQAGWHRQLQKALQARKGARMQRRIEPVPVKFYCFRKGDGSGGTDKSAIYPILDEANRLFSKAGFQFYPVSEMTYIDSDVYYDFNSKVELQLAQAFDVPNVVVVYMARSIRLDGKGVGGYYRPHSTRFFMAGAGAGIFSHEMAHLFGLMHTHENNNHPDPAYRELVARTNCETTGDYVCDTPADPCGLEGYALEDCRYTGTAKDANGSLYEPDLTLMMSYCACVAHPRFSAGQVQLMTAFARTWSFSFSGPGAVAPAHLTASLDTSATKGGVALAWRDLATDELGFLVERRSGEGSDFETIATLAPDRTSWVDTTFGFRTAEYRVKPLSYHPHYSNLARVDAPGPLYCRPVYHRCPDTYANLKGVKLTQGTAIALDNTASSCNTYSFFNDTIAGLAEDETYGLELDFKPPLTSFIQYNYVYLWLDLDQNGTFDARSELVYSGRASSFLRHSGHFTIPIGGKGGMTRLRIRTDGGPFASLADPCAEIKYGEIRDITVKLRTKTRQTISMAAIADQQVGAPGIPLKVTASTTQPVAFRVEAGSASISGDTLYVLGPGVVLVSATLAGNEQYARAYAHTSFCVLPTKPVIRSASEGILTAGAEASTLVQYQWYWAWTPIPGATEWAYAVTQSGIYGVEVKGACGAAMLSDGFTATITAVGERMDHRLRVYPNPATAALTVELPAPWPGAQLLLVNSLGRVVQQTACTGSTGYVLHVAHLPKGLYVLRLQRDKVSLSRKIVVE